MRKVIVISFLTLDGVMQAPGGADEDRSDGFQHGGWQMKFDGDGDNPMADNLAKAGALMLGRKTYDIFAAYWPTEGKDVPWFGDFMNQIPKYVASVSMRESGRQAEWQNSTLLGQDIDSAVTELKKSSEKDIYVLGSGDFAQTLMRHRLVDEFVLMIHPLTLGKGKRLFRPEGPQQDLELVKSKITRDGILVLNYRVRNSLHL